MGAYGSPELHPSEPQDYSNSYSQYSQYPQYPYKPKTHRAAFFFAGLVVGVIVASLFLQKPKASSMQAISPAISQPVVASPYRDDSRDYLKSWAKIAVMKCLVNPSSAQFLDNDADWTFSQIGDMCTVSSTVIEKNKNNTMGKGLFVVKMRYDNLDAEVTYIQIGNKVTYDITKKK